MIYQVIFCFAKLYLPYGKSLEIIVGDDASASRKTGGMLYGK